jgi:hypothetical protein
MGLIPTATAGNCQFSKNTFLTKQKYFYPSIAVLHAACLLCHDSEICLLQNISFFLPVTFAFICPFANPFWKKSLFF